METLGELIHRGRMDKGLTMSKLASQAGLSTMYISELENERKVPTRGDALEKIAACLGLKAGELRRAAELSKLKQKAGRSMNEGKFALARKIIYSKIDQGQMEQIVRILGAAKEES